MVNVGLSFASLLGVALAVSGAGLYFLRSFRPGLARDHDVFFAAVALGCGGILFFNGWRLDPILQFGQFLLAGSAIFFAVESIRLRSVATAQAKRSTPVVDNERPVSRVYRAEFDDYDSLDERRQPATRRIRAARDVRPDEANGYSDDMRRRPSGRGRSGSGRSSDFSDRPRRRRPRSQNRPAEPSGSWSMDQDDNWDTWDDPANRRRSSSRPPGSSPATRPSARDNGASYRPRKPRSSAYGTSRDRDRGLDSASEQSSDYVDYRPINYSDDEA
ncbi:MAG: hypothetical protein F6K19_04015 [Cyanothece sp. SIO1E1]|nr:hypothetical protein [Cyanothece sp. SIO1E1]